MTDKTDPYLQGIEEKTERRTTESARPSQAPEQEQSVQQAIQKELMAAQTALSKVYQLAVGKNPMAADLPVFQRVKEIQKDCTHLMIGIGKVRGL